ncbi:MAG: hypothetical protein ACOCPZ_01515 [Natrialbaceae archaeon]
MVPLQFLQRVAGWLVLFTLLLVPGVVATVLWTPFLAARRLRSLFTTLPPAGRLLPTYVLVCIGASIPYVVGFLAVLATADSAGVAWSRRLFTLALVLSTLYVVCVPLVGALGLPRAGIDWDPTGYGPSTWLLLLVGAAWYALVFAVPLVVLSILFAWPGGY